MKASEAYELTMKTTNESLEYVYEEIEVQAKKGETSIQYDMNELSPLMKEILEAQGYTIRDVGEHLDTDLNYYIVSWNKG